MGDNYVSGSVDLGRRFFSDEAQKRRRSPRMVGIIWLVLGVMGPILSDGFCYQTICDYFDVEYFCSLFGFIMIPVAAQCQFMFLTHLYVSGRYAPSCSMGRSAKFKVDVVILWIALMLRHFVGYSRWWHVTLVSCTIKSHAYLQLKHAFCDFGFWDLLLQVSMQNVIYLSVDNPLAYIVVLVLCGAIILYRYFFYSAPLQALSISEDFSSKDAGKPFPG